MTKSEIRTTVKYTIVSFLVSAILILGCNGKHQTDKETPTDSLVNSAGNMADSAYQRGARLIAANDCLTCHMMDKKSIGPSYYEISQRYHNYEGNAENLAQSIIHGSKGLWGNNAMTPHPNMSFEDAKAMAYYILSLKQVPPSHPNENK